MSNFAIAKINVVTFKISGILDDSFELKLNHPISTKDIWFDLSEVRMTSTGIRAWVRVMKSMKAKIHVINCNVHVTTLFSMVPEIIGKHTVVESVETEFSCEKCSKTKKLMVQIGRDVFWDQSCNSVRVTEIKCTDCGDTMDLEQPTDSYFHFLSHTD